MEKALRRHAVPTVIHAVVENANKTAKAAEMPML